MRKNTDVLIDPSDLVKGLRKLLNENAAIELSKMMIADVLEQKRKRAVRKDRTDTEASQDAESRDEGDSNMTCSSHYFI